MVSGIDKRLVLLVVGLVAIGGCATPIPGGVEPLPSRADGRENVVIVREKLGWLEAPTWTSWVFAVTVDGKNVHRLKDGQSVRFGLEAGTYSLGIRCETGRDLIFSPWEVRELEVEIINRMDMLRINVFDPGSTRGCEITKAPSAIKDGIENVQIVPVPIFGPQAIHGVTLMIDGQDFAVVRDVRFSLGAGEHTLGVRCRTRDDPGEPFVDEVTINIEKDAPLIQVYAGRRGKDSPPCFIGLEK